MEIKELTFETYLKASSLGDEDKINEFYKELWGETYAVLLTYHLKTKKPEDLSNTFTIISDINDMVFGQFIGVEKALGSNLSNEQAIENLAYILLRPISDVEFDNTDKEKEALNIRNILSSDARSVLQILNTFSKHRDVYIKDTYKGVFYQIVEKTDDPEEEEDILEDSSESKFTNNWYWYAIARALAEDGIVFPKREGMSGIECVLMTKMSDIAPELAYKRHRQIIEDARERKRQVLNNSRR